MVNEIHLTPGMLRPVEPPVSRPQGKPAPGVEGVSFQEILDGKISEVRFSAHAKDRMASRNIQLSESELARLNQGIARIDAKGGRDSLVLMDQLAFVVNVPNRTVITAVDAPSLREAVFTQIDSAVVV